MLSHLLKNLSIRKGEGLPVGVLLIWSIFQGVFIAFYLTASNAGFLDDWGYINLPYAFIASGLLGFLVLREFSRWERKVSFKKLLVGSHLVNLSCVLLFSLGSQFTGYQLFSFLTFIWIGPSLTMVALGFWGLAGQLFNLQQGKRLFGLISSGEVASNIGAFLIIPFLPIHLKSAGSLLGFSAIGLAISMFLIPFILKILSAHLAAKEEAASAEEEDEGQVEDRELRGLKKVDFYFFLISAIVFFAVFNQQLLDFTLLAEFDRFESGEKLATFLAVYFGAMSFAELLMKTLVSGRLLRAYGIVAGLFCLPVLVLLCIVFAALKTNSATTFFFVLILVTKILEHVLRFSVFDPSFKVLFQPLSLRERFSVQTRVEGMVRQGSVVVGGIVLLVLTLQDSFEIRSVTRIMVVFLLFWLVATFFVYKEYRKKLMARLQQRALKSVIQSPLALLEQAMNAMSEKELDYALNVIQHVEPGLLNLFLPKIFPKVSPSYREKLLARIRKLKQLELTGLLEQMIEDPEYAETKEQAQRILTELNRYNTHQLPLPKIVSLASSSKPEDRVFAALLLSHPAGAEAAELLRRMLWDEDIKVRQTAIRSAGISQKPLYWSRLIELLGSGIYCKFAGTALKASGDAVVGADFSFYRFRKHPEIQIRILQIHERVGSEDAKVFLLDKIVYPQREVRRQALYSLGYLGYRASAEMVGMVKNDIEAKVKYIAWNTAARLDIGREGYMALTYAALKWEVHQAFEMLYLLLALICDKQAIKLIRENVVKSEESRAFALEVAEHATPPDLKHLLFPLFEYIPPLQRLARLSLHCPQDSLKPMERLLELLVQGPGYINSWTRACAIDAIFLSGYHQVPDELIANLQHHSPMIREITARTIRRLDSSRFQRLLRTLPARYSHELKDLGVEMDSRTGVTHKKLLTFDKIIQLRQIPILQSIHETVLFRYAEQVGELRLNPDERLFEEGDPGDAMFFVISGSINVDTKDGQVVATIGEGQMLGEIAVLETGVRTLGAISGEFTHLFNINRELMMDIMSDHLEIMPDIIKTIVRRRERA